MASQEHILIIGAGIFGASTAYHLKYPTTTLRSSPSQPISYPGPKITLLDHSPLGAGIGASEDINKIIRADYSQKFYMDLGYDAIDAWKSLSEPGGIFEGLYHQTGWTVFDDGQGDHCARIRKLYGERGSDPTKTMGLEELKQLYGGILKDADMTSFRNAYVNPEAGWADAGSAVKRMVEESVRAGVEYKVGNAVDLVLGTDEVKGVKLATGEVILADKIVLSTGAWTSSLMNGIEDELHITDEYRVEGQLTAAAVCVAHYQLTREEMNLYATMPVIVYGEKGEVLPPPRNGLLKFTFGGSVTNTVTTRSGHKISVPPPEDQSIVPPALKDEILSIVKSLMPHFRENERRVDRWRLCWDSITPTQNQLICRHPHSSLQNLYLAVGGSFHSYKFLPIIGKYVANVIRGVSNGEEKDQAWAWKTTGPKDRLKCAHANVIPERDLKDLV